MPTGPCFLCSADRDVADIGYLQRVEGCRAGRHVVGTNQAGFGANLARSESGAATIRGADIEGYANETDIESLGAGRMR
jgi:hypothetical protein